MLDNTQINSANFNTGSYKKFAEYLFYENFPHYSLSEDPEIIPFLKDFGFESMMLGLGQQSIAQEIDVYSFYVNDLQKIYVIFMPYGYDVIMMNTKLNQSFEITKINSSHFIPYEKQKKLNIKDTMFFILKKYQRKNY